MGYSCLSICQVEIWQRVGLGVGFFMLEPALRAYLCYSNPVDLINGFLLLGSNPPRRAPQALSKHVRFELLSAKGMETLNETKP